MVNDAEGFCFLKCLMDSEDTIYLEVPQVTVDYSIEGWHDRVNVVLGNITKDVVVDYERDNRRAKLVEGAKHWMHLMCYAAVFENYLYMTHMLVTLYICL